MLRTFLTRRLYLPLSDSLQGEHMLKSLRELQGGERFDPERLAEQQWAEVLRTLDAAASLPFYRERCDLRAVRSREDFQALPVLEKAQVRQECSRLHRASRGDCWGQTSGSTGQPVRFSHGPVFRSRHQAAQWRSRGWFDVHPGDAMLAVWGRPVSSRSEWALLQFKSFLNHVLHVSAFDLSSRSVRALYPRIRRLRPRLVYGYPSGLEALARQAEQDGFRLDDLGVRLIGSTAEVLYGFQRELLERSFGAPVADVYGCAEFGSFAHQCPAGCMHISCENVLVEFLDEADRPVAPGVPGQVVVTSLHNPGMPLVRYRVGDVAVPLEGRCPCGRSLPMMDVRTGKVGQMVRTGGGHLFSTELFDYLNKRLIAAGHHDVTGFHVIQTGLDDFTVRYVSRSSDPGSALDSFGSGMREVIGTQARIVFERVPEIPRHPGGKLGYFSCEIPADSGS